MADKGIVVQVRCSNCGGDPRNHKVLYRHTVPWGTPDTYPYIFGFMSYDTLKCIAVHLSVFEPGYQVLGNPSPPLFLSFVTEPTNSGCPKRP